MLRGLNTIIDRLNNTQINKCSVCEELKEFMLKKGLFSLQWDLTDYENVSADKLELLYTNTIIKKKGVKTEDIRITNIYNTYENVINQIEALNEPKDFIYLLKHLNGIEFCNTLDGLKYNYASGVIYGKYEHFSGYKVEKLALKQLHYIELLKEFGDYEVCFVYWLRNINQSKDLRGIVPITSDDLDKLDILSKIDVFDLNTGNKRKINEYNYTCDLGSGAICVNYEGLKKLGVNFNVHKFGLTPKSKNMLRVCNKLQHNYGVIECFVFENKILLSEHIFNNLDLDLKTIIIENLATLVGIGYETLKEFYLFTYQFREHIRNLFPSFYRLCIVTMEVKPLEVCDYNIILEYPQKIEDCENLMEKITEIWGLESYTLTNISNCGIKTYLDTVAEMVLNELIEEGVIIWG